MKALIGRHSDGWSTLGFVARLENGRVLTTIDAVDMARQLRAMGVSELQIAGPNDGDRSLSLAQAQLLLELWQQSPAKE